MRGYCEVCQKEYSNIYQHQQTKKQKDMEARVNNEQLGQTGIEEDSNVVRVEDEPEVQPQKEAETDTKIQIIDGEPKKEKSTINEIMEVAFSEQFAPITMSLLNAAVERLQGTHNPERKKGNITYTQAGEEIEDF
jgi:preprotein translocase subunit SecD